MKNIRVRLLSVCRRTRKNVTKDMQETRLKLLNNLEKMFDMAKAYATNKNTKDKQRQIWVRIMAYIGQVMNSISKSVDEAQVTKDLEKLEKMIREAVAKEKSGRVKTRSRRTAPGSENKGSK